MFTSNRHLTDREILQALDGELAEFRLSAVDRHFGVCQTCSARRAAIASAAVESSGDYRSPMSSEPFSGGARARLEVALAREAVEPNRSWLALAPAVGVAALVVLAASSSIYLQSAPVSSSLMASQRLALPVASITPGATWDVSLEELCSGSPRVLPITVAMRAQVLRAYGVEDVPSDQYELDYLVTPELAGATDARNLWPQSYASPVWNARVKDELEQLLPRLVCTGELDLETAQRDMAVDWIAAYRKYFRTDRPLQAHRGPAVDDDDTRSYVLADGRPAPAVRLVSVTFVQ